MEKFEKKETRRGPEFYVAVLDNLRENGGTSTSTELKEAIKKISKDQGYSLEKSSEIWILMQVEKILTDKWLGKKREKEENLKSGSIYSLNIGSESDYNSAKECIYSYFNNRYSRRRKSTAAVKTVIPTITRPHRSIFIKVYGILKWMTENNTNKIFRAKLLEITGLATFSNADLQRWMNNLAKSRVSLDANYVSGGLGNTFLNIINALTL